MKRILFPLLAVHSLAVLCLSARAADIDTVYRKSDGKSFAGQITTMSRNEIVVTQRVGNREDSIPANDIDRVEWKDEPAALTLGRSHERSGNLAAALQSLEEARAAVPPGNVQMTTDIDFLIARAAAKQALRDPEQLPAAIEKLKEFAAGRPDHYRQYDAQLWIGELALAAHNAEVADSAFRRLQQAPWPDYQMAGRLGEANVLLDRKKVADAHRIFNEIAAAKASTPAEQARRLEAILGQAACLTLENQHVQAAETLQQVVREAPPAESRLLARAYLELGHAHAADANRAKEAVLAYLHVDVIPTLAVHSDLHAESLYQLSRLWPAVGHPGRGAEAAARLEQQYPHSEWARKLSAGS